MRFNENINIAVLPGDGIGVDVTYSAITLLEQLNLPLTFEYGDIGWQCWQREGNPIPDRTWALIEKCDVTLLGAITSKPKREAETALPNELKHHGIDYVSPIIQLRQSLDLFANVRSCFNINNKGKQFNFIIIRENTEGLYSGLDYFPLPESLKTLLAKSPKWQDSNSDELAASIRIQSESGLKRLYQFAFEQAAKKNLLRVTLADKPNVLRQTSAHAREIFESIANQYPHIKAEILNVDAIALQIVRKPEAFGVIVAENMFGDILSDVAAGVMGGLGFAPSANMGVNDAYFEPVHGSGPKIKSGYANPSAMFLTSAMMLRYLGYDIEADLIQQSISHVIKSGKVLTYDQGGSATTEAFTDAVIQQINYPTRKKTIAFLATGSELLSGDLQDGNSHQFSKILHQAGAVVRSKIVVNDQQLDIETQLQHLLDNNDVVITTGGLGPTSDDNTRFAIAKVVGKTLHFDKASWEKIQQRLKKFGLAVTDANKKQAMFPEDANILENTLGTANACYLKTADKEIFMLPGPPNECHPLFTKFVMPALKQGGYFKVTNMKRYLTMGLVEGEISELVDRLAKPHNIETAYRWHYPYLEIKLDIASASNLDDFFMKFKPLVDEHVVTKDETDAKTALVSYLDKLVEPVTLHVDLPTKKLLEDIHHKNLIMLDENGEPHRIVYKVTFEADTKANSSVMCLSAHAFKNRKSLLAHSIKTPKRETGFDDYLIAYALWQLQTVIKKAGHVEHK